MQRTVTEAAYAGAPLAVAGALAWATGGPLVSASLFRRSRTRSSSQSA